MSMPNTQFNNDQGGKKMPSAYDIISILADGTMDRTLNLKRTTNPDFLLPVQTIRQPEDEMGAFLAATGATRTVRLAVDKSAVHSGQAEPDEKATVFLISNPKADGTIPRSALGILDPGDKNTLPFMTPDLDVSACVFNDSGRLTDSFDFNTNEWEIAQLWVNDGNTIELILIPKEEVILIDAYIKAGHGPDKVGGEYFGLEMGIEASLDMVQTESNFGTNETRIRDAESSLEMSVGQILESSGIFKTPYQITSEQLIDVAVQFDFDTVGKVMKRLNTLDRTAMINNVINVERDQDQIVFHMFKADGPMPAAFRHMSPERLGYLGEKFFDGAVFVSHRMMDRLRDMLIARYEERDMDVKGGLEKFNKPLTHQIRISGGGLIDQDGNKIGLNGHMKTHIFIADGYVNRWMEDNDVDFLGTDDSYKTDLAVSRDGVIAVVVQPKTPKTDFSTSAQHFSAAGLVNQDTADYRDARRRQFMDHIEVIAQIPFDEGLAKKMIKSMADEADEENDLLGVVRKGANELLATYATLKMRVTDSPAAVYAIQTNMLQKLSFATLSEKKNWEMATGGYGRKINMPAAGYHAQIFPEAFVAASGRMCPKVNKGELHTYEYRGELSIGIVSNEDWELFLSLTGDGDLDDFWNVYFTERDNGMEALVMRHPAVRGEYMMFKLSPTKVLMDIWEPMREKGYIPSIDESKLATRLDRVTVNGAPLKTMSIEEAYNDIFGGLSKFGRKEALEVVDVYVQQLTIAQIDVLGKKVVQGLPTRTESSYFMGRPVLDLNATNEAGALAIKKETFLNGKGMSGPARSTMNTILKDVEVAHPKNAVLHAQINPGINLLPTGHVSFVSYAMNTMYGIIRLNQEHGRNGGVTAIRTAMENTLRNRLGMIVKDIYNEFGIKLSRTENGYFYDKGTSESQTNLNVLTMPRPEDLFGETQAWKQLTNNGRYMRGFKNKTIMPLGLENTELGHLVHNSSISKYLPAASWMRYYYTVEERRISRLWKGQCPLCGEKAAEVRIGETNTTLTCVSFSCKNNQQKREWNMGTALLAMPPAIDLINRRAWKNALENMAVDIRSMDDMYEFILALAYVLRATPTISESNINKNLADPFTQPGNVLAERLLYVSPFMRWTEDGKNLVLSAFDYAKTYKAELLNTKAQAVEAVLTRDVYDNPYMVFVPKEEGGVNVQRPNA